VKLHRLTLRNYRGIAFRDVEFPDRGVVVVCGANEIGKSSMIEALDLLLEAKDRSSKKEVKQVKPTHVDEGAEVKAEISTGPYRFTYFKRYHKRPVTELTVTAPVREQLTGDEAHERVQAILNETVDVALWQAQRVLQTSSTSPVDLSGCDALSRALDVAAGQAVTLSGSEPLLIDRIDEEFRRYFTQTGKPTGEWAAALKRRQAAAAAVAECRSAVAEIEEAVGRHDVLTAELAELDAERSVVEPRLEAARAAADTVSKVAERLTQAKVVADAARSTHAAATAALTERRRLRTELEQETSSVETLAAALDQATLEETEAREAHAKATAAVLAATSDVEAWQARVDAVRTVVEQIARHDEAGRIALRLSKIDAADARLRDVEALLAEIPLSDRTMRLIEAASAAVDVAAAAAEAASARIELVAATSMSVTVAGEVVSLDAGATWSTSATAPTDVVMPGLVTVRVVPGTPAAHTGDELDTKAQVLAQVLRDVGVDDVEAARALDERRRDLTATRQQLRATRDAQAADDDVDALRRRLAALRTDLPADAPDADAARTELDAAAAAHRQALATCAALRDAASAASTRVNDRASAATVLRSRIDAGRERAQKLAERLEQGRASITDDELVLRADAAAERLGEAATRVEALQIELDGAQPAVVAAELTEANALADRLGRRHRDVAAQLVATTAQLGVYGTEGRHGRLDAAEMECAHAEADWARLQRRANAVMLLRSTMTRHRDDARQRYVDPFRVEVERLGRIVFGQDFEVGIDAELRIQTRTLDGCTVPYDSLSGGAKEQLGIVARLAGAALVAKEDGVPVVIDDALGFTDSNRLVKMAEVFDAVGGDGQVIVLTCSPERYAGVIGAQRIELTSAV
jgi:hypothetical protein